MPARSAVWRCAVLLALRASIVRCTDCYYPNGDRSPNNNDQPCSSATGAACCPSNWQCLDNGLCYYPPDDYYGRYGCTDQSWDSPLCPSNLCTHNLTAAGDEAILQCSNQNDQWCCDGDRVHVHCCTDDNIQYFDMPQGKAYATVGSGSTPSSAPTVNSFGGGGNNNGGNSASSSVAPSSSSAPSSSPEASAAATSIASSSPNSASSSSATAVTSIRTSVSSGPAGVSTVFITTAITPSSAPTATLAPATHKSSHLGVIVGCAVGIPVALALVGLLAFLLLRHRRNHRPAPESSTAAAATTSEKFGSTATPYGPAPAELQGNPLGPARPVSVLKGRAELEGPATALGGSPRNHRPADSWATAPPGYSPGMGAAQFGGGEAALANGSQAEGGGAGTAAGGGQRYVAYRPPMQDVPERVELPAGNVRTPPAA